MNSPATETYADFEAVPDNMDAFLAGMEKRAYRIAYLALSDRDEALDVVQDTMMKMFLKYSDKPKADWRPLFYKILSNRITDSHRSNTFSKRLQMWFKRDKKEDEGSVDDIDLMPSRLGEQPQNQLQSDLSMSVLDRSINALPIRQQQAFLFRHWEGLSTLETANAMGCSTGSVKTHLSRALDTLKTSLQPHYEHYE
jgi:RNA polymerase sigma-70 factor (ECF subfamily)